MNDQQNDVPQFDAPWDYLADAGFYVTMVRRVGDEWSVRIASDHDADHDTYVTRRGHTPEAAVTMCADWWRGVNGKRG